MASAPEPVILVHGLWMTGLEFGVLRQRLQTRHGFDVHVFSYPSMHGNVDEIVAELAELARERAAGTGRVHLVGHSLGGAIMYRALEQRGMRELPGNAVLLGSPLNGSRAAHGVGRLAMLRPLIGPHALAELAEPCGRCWPRDRGRSLGAIAGTRRLGTGQFFAHFDEDNDGTVAVSETVIPGLNDHIVLPHSHVGMLFANDVAAAGRAFPAARLISTRSRRPGRASHGILSAGTTRSASQSQGATSSPTAADQSQAATSRRRARGTAARRPPVDRAVHAPGPLRQRTAAARHR